MSRTALVSIVLVLGVGTALSGSAGASPAAAQSVTLAIAKSVDRFTKQTKLRFTGTVSSGQSGQDVTVLQQVCGYDFGTSVAGSQTTSGGFFEAEPANAHVIAPSATYWARWGNETSARLAIHPQIPVSVVPIGEGRIHFSLSIGSVYQTMVGKNVVLERLRAMKWRIVQQRRLTFDPGTPNGTYLARFKVPRRWTVRVRVPQKVAAPCFKPNSTRKVRS